MSELVLHRFEHADLFKEWGGPLRRDIREWFNLTGIKPRMTQGCVITTTQSHTIKSLNTYADDDFVLIFKDDIDRKLFEMAFMS